jgi:hypothetical protein
VSAGYMGIMHVVATEAAVLILAFNQPIDNLVNFGLFELMANGFETRKRPIGTCNLEMFSEILANKMQILAIFEFHHIFEVLFAIKFGILILHGKYYKVEIYRSSAILSFNYRLYFIGYEMTYF